MTNKRAFWISFLISLAVIVPGYLALLAYTLVTPSVAADTPQTDIPVVFPTVQDDRTVLVMTGGETVKEATGYTLVRLDALHRRLTALSLPAGTVVLVEGSPVTLSQAVASAGPTQGVRALEETLDVSVDNYLFTPSGTLADIAGNLGTAKMKLRSYISSDALERLSLAVDGVEELPLSPALLAEVLESGEVTGAAQCELRACGYAAFLSAGRKNLTSLVENVRANSGSIATDLTATQLYDYERLLGFLETGDDVPGQAEALTVTQTAAGTFEITEDAAAQVKRLLQ